MGRIFTFLGLFVMGAASLFAQEIITGTVIDSKGVPIPGARVEVVGRTEYTETDIDGRFRIELPVSAEKICVQYVGFNSVTRDVKPDMVVVLNKGWWKIKPEKYEFFVNLMAVGRGYSWTNGDLEDEAKFGFSIMAGTVKNAGYYVKGFMSPEVVKNDADSYYWGIIGGCILRLWSPIHMYAGLGYMYSKDSLRSYSDGNYYETVCKGLAIDYGLMLRVRNWAINIGVTVTNEDEENVPFFYNLGASYFF